MSNTLPQNYKLNARYTILHQIGQGGFGITYKAYDSLSNMDVCIKELFISGHNVRESSLRVITQSSVSEFDFSYFKRKFLEEAQKLNNFHHANIVKVIDFFEDYNTAYIVMDFVEGQSLKQFVKKTGRLNEKEALFIFHQLLTATKELHRKGFLHRDIKPDNIIITPDKRLVLIDFGLAKAQEKASEFTSTMVMLSHGFSPPEQYSKEGKKGAYTDIYAIGATLYFMLTGEKPTQSTNRIMEDLEPILNHNKKVSNLVINTVSKCMELRPTDRFQSVAEIITQLTKTHEKPVAENIGDQKIIPFKERIAIFFKNDSNHYHSVFHTRLSVTLIVLNIINLFSSNLIFILFTLTLIHPIMYGYSLMSQQNLKSTNMGTTIYILSSLLMTFYFLKTIGVWLFN